MRPSDAFVRPRPVAAVDSDATVTRISSSTSGPVGTTINDTITGVGIGIGGPGTSTAPMMTYFLADENDVDAALEAAGRDAESFRDAIQNARHIRGKPAMPIQPDQSHPAPAPAPAPSQPSRPSTPEAHTYHGNSHAHAHARSASGTSHPPGPYSPTPPSFSPMYSQSGSTSLFGTPGPASLSAMSSSSSRRNSLSGSFMVDDHLGSGGGDGVYSHDRASDLTNSAAACVGDASLADSGGPSPSQFNTDAASLLLSSSSVGLSTVEIENNGMMDSGSAPQLIMPSIKMPSRRPFTEAGKNMGRLKVLIAGDTGLGKTSLVKAIVQSCPHIVHVDQVSSGSFSSGTSRRSSAATVSNTVSNTVNAGQSTIRARRKSSRSSRPNLSTTQISEIYASTKPYPTWWNEVSDGRGQRRRKSLGDNVLDRNICFVDTPGFTGNASPMDTIMPVIEHIEGQLHKVCSNSLNDEDFVGLVSGDGGTSVDVVFYMVSGNLKPVDIDFIRRLTPLTNVIPLLAQADLLRTDGEVADAKERIARQLHEANIKPFAFTVPTEACELALALSTSTGLPQPYAVSSANGSDHDVMDASLLMSPDYVQPLASTDLSLLVEQVFCPDGVSRLRHAAARKFAQWRKPSVAEDGGAGPANSEYTTRPQSLYRPLNFGGGSGSNELGIFANSAAPLGPGGLTAPLGAPPSFALARITDHTRREEQLAQIRLANWAAELQRSLDIERARYEKLARSERAIWLTGRLGECVQDGTLVAVPPAAANAVNAANILQQQQQAAEDTFTAPNKKQETRKANKNARRGMWRGTPSAPRSSTRLSLPTSFSPEDPLGLLEVTAGLRARSLFIFEVLGSLGVLGGVAVWMANHNYHMQLYEWVVGEWTKLWNGEH